jgi:hypothetical protein
MLPGNQNNEWQCLNCKRAVSLVTTVTLPGNQAEIVDLVKASSHQTNPDDEDSMSHFNCRLAQVQGKEKVDIPPEVINEIREIFEARCIAAELRTSIRVRNVLEEKRSWFKLYDHSTKIAFLVGGPSPPNLPEVVENQIRERFRAVKTVYDNHRWEQRCNLPNYSIQIFKYVQHVMEEAKVFLNENAHLPKNTPEKIMARIVKVECKKLLENMFLLQGDSRINDYEILWQSMCVELQQSFPHMNWTWKAIPGRLRFRKHKE